MMDIDLDDDVEKIDPTELIVSDFGNSAPNLAPKRKEKKVRKSQYV
jgi:hypothetical protein